jgi:peroxiredoxin
MQLRLKVSLPLLLLLTSFLLGVNQVSGKTKAYNFTLTDIYGNQFSLSGHPGKVVIIDFFRLEPLCQPCIDEIPHLKSVHDEYSPNQVVIMSLSVSPSDTDDTLRENFVEKYDIPWTVACGADQFAHTEYGVQFIPTLFIVDTDGYYGDPHIGVTSESKLTSEIDMLLSETGNGDSNGDSDAGQTGPPYTLIAIIGGAVIIFLIVGIVAAGQLLGWSEPSKKRRSHKGKA